MTTTPKCSHHSDESMVAPAFKVITIWTSSQALGVSSLVPSPPADPKHSLPGLSSHLPKADSKTFYTETTEGFAPTTLLNNKVHCFLNPLNFPSPARAWLTGDAILLTAHPNLLGRDPSLLFSVFFGVHTERKYQTPLILPILRSPYWSHVHFWFLRPLLIK